MLFGLAAGVYGGLLGIGGGILLVPTFVYFVCLNQHRAHGTSLLSVFMLAVSGLVTYSLHGNVDYYLAAAIAAGGIIGAVAGAHAASRMKAHILRRVFSVFLIVVGIEMILKCAQDVSCDTSFHMTVSGLPLAFATGLAAGFMSSLLGIGGGMVMVPAMVLLMGVGQKVAQAASLAAMVPLTASGVFTHSRLKNVDFRLGIIAGIGAVAGAAIGGTFAASLDQKTLKIIFGVFLIIMSFVMMFKKVPEKSV